MLTLYQLPISHYCEKVRWALEFKQLEYRKVNLLPGLHVKKTKKLSPKTSTPILVHNDKVVYESSDIISYLDQTFSEIPLTPIDEELKQEVLEWERFADTEIGPQVRLLCYHTLLEYPDIVIPIFAHNGPLYGRFLLRRIFPQLSVKMRALMKINARTAQKANLQLSQAINKVYQHIQGLLRKGEGYRINW